MLTVLSVLGTRPEGVKLAPIINELQRRAQDSAIRSVVCSTAQHREMLDSVLSLFEIVPDYDLNVMAPNQTLAQVASRILEKLEPVFAEVQPDWVLVQGDTTTVAAAALGAFYSRLRVGHVEAGLRTFEKWQPFPEEINRRVVGSIADLHFAPTARSRENLLAEGIAPSQVLVTGNPVIDALDAIRALPPTPEMREIVDGLGSRRLILVTAHRRENFGAPFLEVCQALKTIAERRRDEVQLVYPVHRNPNVAGPAHEILGGVPNVTLLPPVDYLHLVTLMQRAAIVITDSGGIQEEAPSLGVPVLVLREKTERPEAVDAGCVKLVGTDRDRIVGEVSRLLDDPAAHASMAQAINPYGDGLAARRIVSSLLGEPVEPFSPGAATPTTLR